MLAPGAESVATAKEGDHVLRVQPDRFLKVSQGLVDVPDLVVGHTAADVDLGLFLACRRLPEHLRHQLAGLPIFALANQGI